MKHILLILIYIMSLHGVHLNLAYGTASMDEYNKKDTVIAMNIWVDEIIKGTEHTMSFSHYEDTALMAEKMKNGEIDIVMTTGFEFVKHFDKSNLIKGFTGGRKSRESENLILVIQKDSNKSILLSLNEPRIAIQKSTNLAKIYAEYFFLKNSKKTQINFIKTKKSNTALLKVFFKKADVAVVMRATFDLAKELNPQIENNLKVLEYTDVCAGSFGFFRSDFDPEVMNAMSKTASNIMRTERGKQVLNIFQLEIVLETKVEELEPIENLYNEYNRLKINQKGK